MEISLEKIELVKDRTGVNYKEAKDALIKADGSVVDAIIMIEDEIDLAPKSKAGDQASHLIDRLKKLIKKGNVSRIVVKKDEETILNIPVNLGIVGAVWVFWPTLVATVVALGMKCTIELIKDNGEVVSLSDKAADTFGDVKENCSVIADDLKGKGGEAFSQVKDKAASAISKAKAGAEEVKEDIEDDIDDLIDCVSDGDDIDIDDDDYDDDYFNFDDYVEPEDDDIDSIKADKISEEAAPAEHEKEAAASASEQEEAEAPEPAAEESEAPADAEAQEDKEEKQDDALDEIQRAGEKFEETIADYTKKKGRFRFFD